MDPFVFGAVLVAAAFHASWNALIKIRLDPFLAIVLIAAMAGLASLPGLFFVPIPPLAAWPWLIASVITHVGYYVGLSRAYRSGDMGQVYPIARGTAPLMTAAGGALLVGENFSLIGWAGIVALGYAATGGARVDDAWLAERFEIDIAGERVKVAASLKAPYDPAGAKLKG